MKFQRDMSQNYPLVYQRFEGKTLLPNGQKIKYVIQDITEEYEEEVVHQMLHYFLRDEPLSAMRKIQEDPVSLAEFEEAWRECLKHKVGLVCLVENLEELEDKTLPKVAGCNITLVCERGEQKESKGKGKAFQAVCGFIDACMGLEDCFKKYNVDAYLYAFGLSVHPAFRGQGIGLELLKARFPLCRAIGLKLTVTVFTAIPSQKLATRAGFETVGEIEYETYQKDGEYIFKGMAAKSSKLMAIRVD